MLSVVMPAHNEQDYLKAAGEPVVGALRCQGEHFEVLVVENGSTDETRAVANSLAEHHPEVKALTLGVADYGAALRCGLPEADGDWVVNFDVDFVDLSFLRQALEVAECTGAVVVVDSRRGPGLGVNDTHGLSCSAGRSWHHWPRQRGSEATSSTLS
ncbi:MAG: glycosyltransferase family 2 protein [Actinomycetota bacterium]|nr:glycosyltransferase family 2 protein [Actinomycetota bacterium]